MRTKICQDTRRTQGMVSTCLLVSAWLYANISSLELLFESFILASSFNLMLIGLALALLLVKVVRDRVETRFASLVSGTPVLRPYPLLLMVAPYNSSVCVNYALLNLKSVASQAWIFQ